MQNAGRPLARVRAPASPWALAIVGAVALASLLAPAFARASPAEAVNEVRRAGCGSHERARPLRREPRLDAAAERMARGTGMHDALERAGYRAEEAVALHVGGTATREDDSLARVLARRYCADVANPALAQVGVARRGADVWLVLAAPFDPPTRDELPRIAQRVLALVNEARESGRRCGGRGYEPAPAVRLDARLSSAALAHSREMAATGRFEHEGARGDTPADRVRRTGYEAVRVGENIAAGPESAEEVVRGWLDSPGHCANLMDPRFTAMGLAYDSEPRSRGGIYWTQVFATPR